MNVMYKIQIVIKEMVHIFTREPGSLARDETIDKIISCWRLARRITYKLFC